MKALFARTLLSAVVALLSISAASAVQLSPGTSGDLNDAGSALYRAHDKDSGPWPQDNSKD